MSLNRIGRMNEEMRKMLSLAIREMKDPRISVMTTITRVEATPDLKFAKVFVSVYDEDDAARAETVSALNHAEGFLARELGLRMQIRRVPALTFTLDDSIAYSVHISKVLNDLHKKEGD